MHACVVSTDYSSEYVRFVRWMVKRGSPWADHTEWYMGHGIPTRVFCSSINTMWSKIAHELSFLQD